MATITTPDSTPAETNKMPRRPSRSPAITTVPTSAPTPDMLTSRPNASDSSWYTSTMRTGSRLCSGAEKNTNTNPTSRRRRTTSLSQMYDTPCAMSAATEPLGPASGFVSARIDVDRATAITPRPATTK